MISLSEILLSDIKWIVGFIDEVDSVHHRVIKNNEDIDSHLKIWKGMVKHKKWRWIPSNPNHINTYGEEFDYDDLERIWKIVDKYRL